MFEQVTHVNVVIFAAHSKVEGLHGVPRNGVTGKVERCPRQRHGGPEVEQDDRSVEAARRKHRRLHLVECHGIDRVHRVGPAQHVWRGIVAFQVIDGHRARRRRSGKDVARPVHRQARKAAVAEPRRDGRRLARRVVGIPKLDGLIGCRTQQALILGPADAPDNVLVCALRLPDLVPARHVKDLDSSVATRRRKPLQTVGVLSHCIDAVDVALAELGHEGRRVHALEFDCIESFRISGGRR